MVNAEFSRIYRFVKLLVNEGFLAVNVFMVDKRDFNPEGLECLIWSFFENVVVCWLINKEASASRGQWWWHMLKNITWNAWMGLLSSEFVIFVSEVPVTSKWKSSSSNNNSTFSRLWLMLTILLWKVEKLDLTMFSGSFSLNNMMLCRKKYWVWMRWLGKLYSVFT